MTASELLLPAAGQLARLDRPPIEQLRSDFSDWLLSCALGEAYETYLLFLDNTWELLLKGLTELGCSLSNIPTREKFHKKDMGAKFDLVGEHFSGLQLQALPFHLAIDSLRKARNCITHRLGLVSDSHDSTDAGPLVTFWYRMADSSQGHPPGTWILKQKEFPVGDRVSFTTMEISEIFMMMIFAAREATFSVAQHLKDRGLLFKQEHVPLGFVP